MNAADIDKVLFAITSPQTKPEAEIYSRARHVVESACRMAADTGKSNEVTNRILCDFGIYAGPDLIIAIQRGDSALIAAEAEAIFIKAKHDEILYQIDMMEARNV